MNRRTQKRVAFTLIEVLIVVAIVAVLAAIIFPVFSSARAKARQNNCISNIRQVGLGTIMYTNDYDDTYPPYYDHVEGDRCKGTITYTGSGKYWTEIVSSYIQKVRQIAATQDGHQARLEDLPSVYLCPEASDNSTQPQNYKPGNLSGYGINDHVVNWWTPDHCGGFVPVATQEVVLPAQCLLLLETFDWFSPAHDRPGAALALSPLEKLSAKINGAVGTVDGRHSMRYRKTTVAQEADSTARNTVFFCDGHVASKSVGSLIHSADFWSIKGTGTWP